MKLKKLVLTAVLGAAPALAPRRAASEEPLPPVLDASIVDAGADPCSDFFQYACGGWLKDNPVPADESKWYRFSELDERTRWILRAILAEAAAERDRASADTAKIGAFYAACMDEPEVEARGAAPLRPELDRIDAIKDKAALAVELARLHSAGAGALFAFTSAQDYTDATRMIANSDQGGLSLPDRDYYLLDDFKDERRDFAAHVGRMFGLLGDSPETSAAEAGTVLKVETALARASMGRVERREPKNVHNKMTLAAFEALTPSFDWAAYLKEAGSPAFESLDVSDPGFFRGLEASLAEIPLEDWKTELRWSLLHGLVSALPKAFVQEDFEFFGRRLGGQKELKPRWKRCVAAADQGLGEALGRAYVEREFSPEAKRRVLSMVDAIERAMAADVKALPWMGGETKTRALAKLAAVADKIGYPDKWRDYSALAVSTADALGNLERADAFEFRRQLAKVGAPTDRGEWSMTPPTDNAYYDPQMNDINFPAGILQRPNFDLKADSAALLGALGATIGHELTHGFDDEGRHYDAAGNLADWWTEADGKAFEERAKGFVDEYSGFVTVKDANDPAKDVRLNGKLTLGENIADNGGLILASMALDEALTGASSAAKDEARRRFFLSYAQSWCANQTEASSRKSAKVDPHSTGRWRVNGVVVNMPEFARAYSCKAGSPMASEKPNRVW